MDADTIANLISTTLAALSDYESAAKYTSAANGQLRVVRAMSNGPTKTAQVMKALAYTNRAIAEVLCSESEKGMLVGEKILFLNEDLLKVIRKRITRVAISGDPIHRIASSA